MLITPRTFLIIVQQDATVFSLLYFCRQLYMFRGVDTHHQELVQL